MTGITIGDLQESIKDKDAFNEMEDFKTLCTAFLQLVNRNVASREYNKIISPSNNNYMFYQYGEDHGHKIMRPLNRNLFIESHSDFSRAYDRFIQFLDVAKVEKDSIVEVDQLGDYINSNEIHKCIYTIQQSIGCIGDSFENPNQSRKRIGQLFEVLIRGIISSLGLECCSKNIKVPIPDNDDYEMSYELDMVFSNNSSLNNPNGVAVGETVGSIKTTSKDRIDKIFLDKYLLSEFMGRDIPTVAVFLHDVQRAKRGQSIFGINSTFKSNHFMCYSVALTALDGVYYIDPRPEMHNEPLNEYINTFQHFLTHDIWNFV